MVQFLLILEDTNYQPVQITPLDAVIIEKVKGTFESLTQKMKIIIFKIKENV